MKASEVPKSSSVTYTTTGQAGKRQGDRVRAEATCYDTYHWNMLFNIVGPERHTLQGAQADLRVLRKAVPAMLRTMREECRSR